MKKDQRRHRNVNVWTERKRGWDRREKMHKKKDRKTLRGYRASVDSHRATTKQINKHGRGKRKLCENFLDGWEAAGGGGDRLGSEIAAGVRWGRGSGSGGGWDENRWAQVSQPISPGWLLDPARALHDHCLIGSYCIFIG